MAVLDRQYSVLDVEVSFDGLILNGFADGDLVTITPSATAFDSVVGAKGEYATPRNPDQGASITIRLQQGSVIAQAKLLEVINRQKALGLGAGRYVVIAINDVSTGEKIVCSRCWIEQEPTMAFGSSVGPREYTWRTDSYTRVILPL
jgi:hypothetical protein